MKSLKKAGIIGGAVVGCVIGGTISVIGKVSNKKFVDQLGSSIVDSTIMTGDIVGTVASGATEVISGVVKKDIPQKTKGKKELKKAGGKVVDNFVDNFKTVADSGEEIFNGVKKRDHKKVVKSVKRLAKVIIIGAITVGAIKLNDDDENDEK